MLGPSLFGDARLLVLRAAQDLRSRRGRRARGPTCRRPAEGTDDRAAARRRREGQGAARSRPQGQGARDRAARKLTRPTSGPTSSGPRSAARRADRAGRRRRPRRRGRQRPARARRGVRAAGQRLRRARSTSTWSAPTTGAAPRCPASRWPTLPSSGSAPPALEALRLRAGGRGAARASSPTRSPTGCARSPGSPSAGRGDAVRAGRQARHAAVEGEAGRSPGPRLVRAGRARGARGRGRRSTPT